MNRYSFAKGVTLQAGQEGSSLIVDYPRRILKLNAAGAEAVKQACGIAPWGETWNTKSLSFILHLENQGILTRNFPRLAESKLPFVSIVVPTYNRAEMLGLCLQSLLNLDYPSDKLEIIVVDDFSPLPVDVDLPSAQVIRLERNSGPGEARNTAVRSAKGEVIAFLDDDCLAGGQWLKNLVPCFQFPDVAAAGGKVEPAALDRALERYEEVQSPLSMGDESRKVRRGSAVSYLPTCNLLVRRKSLLEVDGFDPAMRVGEDVDLCWRLLEQGGNIYYLPSGKVFHHHRARLIPFLRRRHNYGQSEAVLQARFPVEKRRLYFFPGHISIVGITVLVTLLAGVLPGLATGAALIVLNQLFQSGRKFFQAKKAGCNPGFSQVFRLIFKSQATAAYVYSQHFSRYYSIFATGLTLLLFPPAAAVLALVHGLSGIVDYRLKKPALGSGSFILYHCLEDAAYQTGVLRGCLAEHNWRPLRMDFIRADGTLPPAPRHQKKAIWSFGFFDK